MHPEAGVVPYLPTELWHSPFTLTPPHAPDISSIYAPSMPRGVMRGHDWDIQHQSLTQPGYGCLCVALHDKPQIYFD